MDARLAAPYAAVASAGGDQGIVTALLGDVALVHHKNPIGMDD
jgi:hypothetical protein